MIVVWYRKQQTEGKAALWMVSMYDITPTYCYKQLNIGITGCTARVVGIKT